MVRQKDELWKHVKAVGDNRFSCNYCKMVISGGITRIRFHLSGRKGGGIKTCPQAPEDVQIEASQQIQASNRVRENEIISTSASKKKTKSSHHPKVAGACKKDKRKVDKALAEFMDSNNWSLDVSRIPHLRDLLICVAEFGPGYELPTSSDLQSYLDKYKEIEEYIAKTKKLFNKTGCTLIITKVETNLKLECLNFFACSPGGWICLEKVRFLEEGMTFSSFIDNVCHKIQSLGPNNVVQVILDDSKDRTVRRFADFTGDNFFHEVMKVIQRKYAWIYVCRCANGELEVILLRICLEVSWIHDTLQLAKQIFKQLLRKEQHPRNREYSCSEVKEIAIELSMLISILQDEKELQALQTPVVQEANSTDFWRKGKKVVQVLQPLFQVLELIDGYESTSGYLTEALKMVEEAFKQHIPGKDWGSHVAQPIHEVAGSLNPAYIYKYGRNFDRDSEEIKMVSDRLKLLVPDAEWEALLKDVQAYFSEESAFFNTRAIPMLEKFHPWKLWEIFGDPYPTLQKIAMRILSQTCSTSLCDHIPFGQDGLVNESDMNMNMKKKFDEFESKRLLPIDLDKINGLPVSSHEDVQKILKDLDGPDNNKKDEVPTAIPDIRHPAISGPHLPGTSHCSVVKRLQFNSGLDLDLSFGSMWFMLEGGNNISGSGSNGVGNFHLPVDPYDSAFDSKSISVNPNLLPMGANPVHPNPSESRMPIQPGNGPRRANINEILERVSTLRLGSIAPMPEHASCGSESIASVTNVPENM